MFVVLTGFGLMQSAAALGVLALVAVRDRAVGLALTGTTAGLCAVGLALVVIGAVAHHRRARGRQEMAG